MAASKDPLYSRGELDATSLTRTGLPSSRTMCGAVDVEEPHLFLRLQTGEVLLGSLNNVRGRGRSGF